MELIESTSLSKAASRSEIEAALERDGFRSIQVVNWQEYPETVSSQWKMLHGPDAFFLYFKTQEPYIRAKGTGDNSPVCEDSCVEFFVAFDQKYYYNFEFNPIGAYTIQKGQSRSGRKTFAASELSELKIWTSEPEYPFDTRKSEKAWQVWCVLPFSFFEMDQSGLKKSGIKANFYKCGDALPNRHYLSWVPVKSEQPDFHRPEFFHELILKD